MENLRACIFAAGSGAGAFSNADVCAELITLAGSVCCTSDTSAESRKKTVLYIGTALYDAEEGKVKQTKILEEEHGCVVDEIRCTYDADLAKMGGLQGMKTKVQRADIILVSGGNTLFAVNRWNTVGLADVLVEARGDPRKILCGGSAGAICWFEAGHSDSADPSTFLVESEETQKRGGKTPELKDDVDTLLTPWSYIRVPGLGLLPGMCVPHADAIQSNGILRSTDVDSMLCRLFQKECCSTSTSSFDSSLQEKEKRALAERWEQVLCIDHWAVFITHNGTYRVWVAPGKTKLNELNEDVDTGDASNGLPWILMKRIVIGDNGNITVVSEPVPPEGSISEVFTAPPSGPRFQPVDQRVRDCEEKNPDPNPPDPNSKGS